VNVWKIVCATLVIFIAGIVTGVVLMRLGERGGKNFVRPARDPALRIQTNNAGAPNLGPANNPKRPNDNSGNPSGGPMSREFVVLLERQLQLSPAQREQVTKLMLEGQERIRQLRQKVDPEVRKEMQQTHEKIQSLLTPEQREQFQRLIKQRPVRRVEGMGAAERRQQEPREPKGPVEFRVPKNPLPPAEDARQPEPQTP